VVSRVLEGNRGSLPVLEKLLRQEAITVSRRHLARVVDEIFSERPVTDLRDITDQDGLPINGLLIEPLIAHAHRSRLRLLVAELITIQGHEVLVWRDRKGTRWWASLKSNGGLDRALGELSDVFGPGIILIPHGEIRLQIDAAVLPDGVEVADYVHRPLPFTPGAWAEPDAADTHAHLDQLEAESIRIIRETVANASKPAMLFSLGKDSMVMWALAKKAFWPERPPIPLALIDSRCEFQEVYQVLDYIRSDVGTTVLVHTNPEAIEKDVNPFDLGSAGHTDITRTQGLRQFMNLERFDFIF
jgi:3''-phosphoadenosine 5''-phosphosulfate sulfotransferase (PAPS reductase)/FAD synthetase and related enzymes